jgi:hypothetical protein
MAKKTTLTLKFIRHCPDIGKKKGDTIEMAPAEYKALSKVVHPKNKNRDEKKTPKPLDARINHTKIVDGEELLSDKPMGPKAPAKMSIEECQAELTEKEVEFDADAKVTDLRALVTESRK